MIETEAETMFYIYKIINKINGKLYVGQTTKSISKRWIEHLFISKGGKQKYYSQFSTIHAAIVKYGEENFVIEQLDIANNIDELNEKEIQWIKQLKENYTLYNLTDGGGGTMGYKHTEDTKVRMSEIKKGENNPFYGRKHNIETLEKYSHDRNGKLHTDETKKKMSQNNKGSIITEEIAISIIDKLKNNQSMTSISKELNIGYSIVNGIKRNKNWKHLPR